MTQAFQHFWKSLNVSWMPAGNFYVGGGGDTYGDVVIWLWRLYISWNWGRPYPRAWYRKKRGH